MKFEEMKIYTHTLVKVEHPLLCDMDKFRMSGGNNPEGWNTLKNIMTYLLVFSTRELKSIILEGNWSIFKGDE